METFCTSANGFDAMRQSCARSAAWSLDEFRASFSESGRRRQHTSVPQTHAQQKAFDIPQLLRSSSFL